MKCPSCNINHRRGKQGMVCRCGYEFVFDPKKYQFTDGKFLATVRRASANGTHHYTENQLYAAACRRMKVSISGVVGLLIFAVAGVFVYISTRSGEWIGFAFASIVGLLGLSFALSQLRPKLRRKKWARLVKRWLDGGNTLDGLIRERRLVKPPPDYDETDLYDYGVEQVVVCQHDYLVDWLVLNRFHFNNRTAVISESGYPSYLLPVINELLTGDDPPDVYLVHDPTEAGRGMAARIAASRVLVVGKANVTDLGLTGEIVPRIKSLDKVRRSMGDDQVPVDAIPFGIFQGMAAAAFTAHCAFNDFLTDTNSSIHVEFESILSGDGDGE